MHLSKKQLEKYRQALLEMRQSVLNRLQDTRDLQMSTDDLTDESDHAAAMIQQSVALNMKEKERQLLSEIDHALEKFEDNTYGICEDTEEPIESERLDAQPWTRYSVEAAELREKRAKRFFRGA